MNDQPIDTPSGVPSAPTAPVHWYYYDDAGWLTDTPIVSRATAVAPPVDPIPEGWAWNYLGVPGRVWVAMEKSPISIDVDAHVSVPRMISVGAYFDRFGPAKWAILSSADPFVQALVKDCNVRVRSGIDLGAADVAKGLAILRSKGFDVSDEAILAPEITAKERP